MFLWGALYHAASDMQSAINAHEPEFGRLHAARKVARRPASGMALWRSGDAADCKSVHAGSIPAGASKPSEKAKYPVTTQFSDGAGPAQRALAIDLRESTDFQHLIQTMLTNSADR
jgi:hypothetical protein